MKMRATFDDGMVVVLDIEDLGRLPDGSAYRTRVYGEAGDRIVDWNLDVSSAIVEGEFGAERRVWADHLAFTDYGVVAMVPA